MDLERPTTASLGTDVLFAVATPGEFEIYRDDRIRSIFPRPDFAAHFPLPGYQRSALPGAIDPDAGVVSDARRPLVLYALDPLDRRVLSLVKAPAGTLRLDW